MMCRRLYRSYENGPEGKKLGNAKNLMSSGGRRGKPSDLEPERPDKHLSKRCDPLYKQESKEGMIDAEGGSHSRSV